MRSWGLLLALLAAVGPIAGCGASSSTQDGAGGEKGSRAKACELLTAQGAQSVLRKPVKAGAPNGRFDVSSGDSYITQCNYSAKSGAIDPPHVSLLVRHSSPDQAKQAFEAGKSTFSGREVDGLGDAAYRTKSPGQLDVLKGGNWLIISAGTVREPDTAAQERAAREILAKL